MKIQSYALFQATIFIIGMLIFSAEANAEDLVFPFPKGDVYVTNGYEGSDTHQGVSKYSLDFRTYQKKAGPCSSYGAPVLATDAGQVFKIHNAREDGSYGTYVTIKDRDEKIARYTHLIENSIMVKGPTINNKSIIGDSVQQGQILGLLGDTGRTKGIVCTAFDGTNEGAHLHFEMRDQDGKAFKPEPLIGEKSYTNISEAGNPYESTTIMVDPENHWDQYDGIVPYKLSYNPVRINTIEPLSIFAGAKQTFTITGENLPEDLSLHLNLCESIKWLKRERNEQQFACDIKEKFSRTQQSLGFFTSAQYGKVPFRFEIEILDHGSLPEQQKITEITHNNARPGQVRTFTIQGKNLPGDLKWSLEPCENISYPFRSSHRQIMTCRIPRRLTGTDGKRINAPYTFNAEVSSPETGFRYQYSFTEDYEVKILWAFPPVAAYGKRTTFTFVGKNVDLAQAFFIERCGNLQEKERSENFVSIECTPLLQKWFFSFPLPSIFKKGFHYFVVKDQPGGEILKEGQILMMVSDEIFVSAVEPTRPILGQENTFTVFGNNLPPMLSISIDNCNNITVHPKQGDTVDFTCTPIIIGGADILAQIKAAEKQFYDRDGMFKKTSDMLFFEKILEAQKRGVEIKLPKGISDTETSDPITIYKAELKPITLAYEKYLIFLEHAFPKDIGGASEQEPKIIDQEEGNNEVLKSSEENQKMLEYVLQANGNYSDEFLQSVGWKRLTEGQLKKIYEELKEDYIVTNVINDIHDFQNYELVSCSDDFKRNYGMQEFNSRRKVGVLLNESDNIVTEYPLRVWMNTFGACSDALEHLFGNWILNEKYKEIADRLQNYFTNFEKLKYENLEIWGSTGIMQRLAPVQTTTSPDTFDVSYQSLSQEDHQYLEKHQFHLVDSTYDWYFPYTGHYASYGNRGVPWKQMLEPKDCGTSPKMIEMIMRYATIGNTEKIKIMEKIWLSDRDLPLKFFLQNALDFIIFQAQKMKSVVEKKHYSCFGFWFQWWGLNTAFMIVESPFEEIDRRYRMEYYD